MDQPPDDNDPVKPFRDLFEKQNPPARQLPPPTAPRVTPSNRIADLFPHAPRGPIGFVVPGDPVAWERAGLSGGRHYDPQTEEKRVVRDRARQAGVRTFAGPMGIDVVASTLFPRSWKTGEIDAVIHRMRRSREVLGAPKTTRPDADNLLKLVLDALNGLAYEDDAQVWYPRCMKVYGPRSETRVRLWYGSAPPSFPERWWEPPSNAPPA